MSDGGGFVVGIGAGMGAGIAVGVGIGMKRARQAILQRSAGRAISLRDSSGNEIPMEQFLEETLGADAKSKRVPPALLVFGLLALAAVVVYVLLSRGG